MAQLLAAPFSYFADANGSPLNGGLVYTYQAGTTTPKDTYTDSSGATPAANPVVLDSGGKSELWLSGSYKIKVTDSLGNVIHTTDNVIASGVTGDMTKATYDAANIQEQLVGLTASQTVTNKKLGLSVTPQGRLTLVTGVPVMVSDQTAKTIVYYTPYAGNIIPINDGTNTLTTVFTQLTLTLNTSDNLSTNLYDIFVYSASGVVSIGTGPAWSSGTSRGTGAGTTELQQTNGLWVNKNAIVLRNNGVASSSVAVNQATYVGTIYCTANGQTGMAFNPTAAAGGTNNTIGLYNAYNRVRVIALNRDNTASWTYTSATVRAANNNNSNRINFIDGLAQSQLEATYTNNCACVATTAFALLGLALDVTNAVSSGCTIAGTSQTNNAQFTAIYNSVPQLGFHFLQAVEQNTSGVSTATYGNLVGTQSAGLRLSMDM